MPAESKRVKYHSLMKTAMKIKVILHIINKCEWKTTLSAVKSRLQVKQAAAQHHEVPVRGTVHETDDILIP